jgi:single-strand DNA-binding protein
VSTPVTLCGRMVRDPEMSYSQKGTAVARFAVVTSRRVKDRDSGEWRDESTSFWECVAFGQMAENIAESLEKGTAVLVTGHAAQEKWTNKEGEPRTSWKVTVDEAGPSLRWATAQVKRTERERPTADRPPAEDPWAAATPEEPPF